MVVEEGLDRVLAFAHEHLVFKQDMPAPRRAGLVLAAARRVGGRIRAVQPDHAHARRIMPVDREQGVGQRRAGVGVDRRERGQRIGIGVGLLDPPQFVLPCGWKRQ